MSLLRGMIIVGSKPTRPLSLLSNKLVEHIVRVVIIL